MRDLPDCSHSVRNSRAVLDKTGFEGTWYGELNTQNTKIPLLLYIGGAGNEMAVKLDSPTQGAFGISASHIDVRGTTIDIAFSSPEARFVAVISRRRNVLAGKWFQGKASLPLSFTRRDTTSATDLTRPRPQDPVPPFPYTEEQVTYTTSEYGVRLAGTLTIPNGPGPFPAVLLVSGSGLQDRNQSLFGHKPFLVWADFLTRHGFVVLRSDDRQVGGSTGDVASATTMNFAADAEAGVALLRLHLKVDPKRVGLMGHSEGSIVGAILAGRSPSVAFLIMLAGVGEPGDEMLIRQKLVVDRLAGISASSSNHTAEVLRRLYAAVKGVPLAIPVDNALNVAWCKAMHDGGVKECIPLPDWALPLRSPWMRWLIRYDPASTLNLITCPTLALTGSTDLQTPAAANLPAIASKMRPGARITTITLNGLNHLLQTSSTGDPSEYGLIAETVSPNALFAVYHWLKSLGDKQSH